MWLNMSMKHDQSVDSLAQNPSYKIVHTSCHSRVVIKTVNAVRVK